VEPGGFIILGLPAGGPGVSALAAGEALLVHTLGFPVCQFNSRILQVVDDPALLLLSYPGKGAITQVHRRKSERMKVLLPGRCWSLDPEGNQLLWEGHILDISETGCLVLGDLGERLGQPVRLVFRVPWSEGSLRIPARVVRTATGGKGMQSGLEFSGLDSALRANLEEALSSLQEGGIVRLFHPGGQGPEETPGSGSTGSAGS
jgi:c-di-GMP-binding flagellar brake protein YcgR